MNLQQEAGADREAGAADAPAADAPAADAPVADAPAAAANDNEPQETVAHNTDSGQRQADVITNVNEPSLFRVTLRFFIMFWTSLIPAQPAPVNAN